MNIQINEAIPIEKFPYQKVGGMKDRSLETVDLPIYKGIIQGLKTSSLDYLIIASDLQGNIFKNEAPILLGEVLPDFLKLLFDTEFPTVNLDRVGVLLCGDFYARLDKRGGLGDVKKVWQSFNQHFGFVVGVAGNHDDFGDFWEFEAFKEEPGIYYLDGKTITIGDLKIAGLSGIIGKPSKAFRNEETYHLKTIKHLLRQEPDFLLLHQSPNHLDPKLPGNNKIRETIEAGKKTVICCGHSHWKTSLVEMENGTQIINADAKCIILEIKEN